jgi:hypothetical protein
MSITGRASDIRAPRCSSHSIRAESIVDYILLVSSQLFDLAVRLNHEHVTASVAVAVTPVTPCDAIRYTEVYN